MIILRYSIQLHPFIFIPMNIDILVDMKTEGSEVEVKNKTYML